MTINNRLYNRITVKGPGQSQQTPNTKIYKGFSTISDATENFGLYDLALIKQDIVNHFHIRQGEKLENPTFGTIIWDLLYEPFTPEVRNAIVKNVEDIINYDPRIKADQIIVNQYESGIQIECELIYLNFNISESLQFKFDQDNGLIS